NPRLVQPGDESDEDDDEDEDEDIIDDDSRLELREDRLVMIESWLGGGWKRYSYTLRAVSTGDFVLPGTAAEGMYEPNRRAILPGGFVSVR
ncbi:hypothetical protein LJB99_04670, partial [Deltaproteobacteria bacterium OttesenSCG-928-K17]|nr:hypothetical protein [Deltaproteobacteria bacterium OttesenSCG-928-K17]